MGDFNSPTGVSSDFEQMHEQEYSRFEEIPSIFYFDYLIITDRVNKDKCLNNNGNKPMPPMPQMGKSHYLLCDYVNGALPKNNVLLY